MKASFIIILAFAAVAAGCSGKTGDKSTLYNQAASFSVPAGLPAGFLEWKVICTMIDRKHQTMSTLYGNDTAIAYARSNRQGHYPKEAILALVNWRQQEDGRWFGARIAGNVESVELVTFNGPAPSPVLPRYKMFRGKPLQWQRGGDAQAEAARAAYIVQQEAAIIP
ncbi:MAG TPA: cytochrome P460 family protein [Chitinophagaceae bacterium]|nr:cytochrome P460 family protein [Chitinophagaceae bacterium]